MSKTDRHRVKPGERGDLRARDADCRRAFDGDKAAGRARLVELNRELETLRSLKMQYPKPTFDPAEIRIEEV